MARKLLRQIVTVGTSFILVAGLFFGLALWRRAEDGRWCQKATARSALPADGQPEMADVLERQRSACAIQRQRQRVMFGALWRTGGQEMAACGFDLARLQLVSDEGERDAILRTHGVDDAEFEVSSREDQDRFIQACAMRRHKAG